MGNREERPTLEELYENVEMDDSLSESEMKIVKEQIRREYEKKENRTAKSKKKIVLIVLAVLVAVACIAVGLILLVDRLSDRDVGNGVPDSDSETQYNYYFYPADYSENIFSDSKYMDTFDRTVYYTDPDWGLTTSVSNDAQDIDEKVMFIYDWIQMIMKGQVNEYNDCFTRTYLKEHGKTENFTQQKLYQINISPYQSSDEDVQGRRYLVEFNIYQNNGTYTQRVGSDMTLYTILTIEQSGSSIKISNLQYMAQKLITQGE